MPLLVQQKTPLPLCQKLNNNMMDKDSKLIFESYNRINEQVYENEDLFSPETYKNTIISWNVAQVLDPTVQDPPLLLHGELQKNNLKI